MRALWKGSIGFGLVNIPIGLYSATEESTLSFVSIDRQTKSRIRYRKVSEASGKEVKNEDILKAFEVDGNLVTVDEEDFEKALPTKKDHIDIVQFVNEKEIDAIYFEKPYYLAPEKGGDRAYALLRDALKKEAKAALGLFVFHKREWVCLLKPFERFLVMHRLRFAEEVRDTRGLAAPESTVKSEELKMATSLIAQLTKPFEPDQFKDEYTQKLRKVIEAKAKGKSPSFKAMKVVHTTSTEDLMAKLKASLKPAKKAS